MDGDRPAEPGRADVHHSRAIPSGLLAKAGEGASRVERLLRGLAGEGEADDRSPADLGWAIRAVEAIPHSSNDSQEGL